MLTREVGAGANARQSNSPWLEVAHVLAGRDVHPSGAEPVEKGQDLGVDARPVRANGPLDAGRRRPLLVAANVR